MKCPHCDQEHPETSKFCPETGKPMPTITWICKNPACDFRQPLPITAKFCPNCRYEKTSDTSVENVVDDFPSAIKDTDLRLPISVQGKYGFINNLGQIVINPVYDSAFCFKNNCGLVKQNNQWMVINRFGHIVTQAKKGFELPKMGISGLYWDNDTNRLLYDYNNHNFVYIPNIFDRVGTEIEENLFWVRSSNSKKYGYFNNTLRHVIEFSYDRVSSFKDGLAIVSVNGKWGAINSHGEYVIYPIFEYLGEFSDDVAIAKVGNKYGCINTNGSWILEPRFHYLSDLKNGLLRFDKDGGSGYYNKFLIDLTGKKILSFTDWIYSNPGCNLLALYRRISNRFDDVEKNAYLYNLNLKKIGNYSFDSIGNHFVKGFIPFLKDERLGVISTNGEVILYPTFEIGDLIIYRLHLG